MGNGRAHVFFFRGLSTHGHDHAAFAGVKLTSLYQKICKELENQGLEVTPVLGMGTGTLDEVFERALSFLEKQPAWAQKNAHVHLVGHSAGGLIARMIEQRFPEKVVSCTTIATAHHGSGLAARSVEVAEGHPYFTRTLSGIGYDLKAKSAFFRELTPKAVAANPRLRNFASNKNASVVCNCTRDEWSWPMRLMHALPPFRDLPVDGDGFVERESQVFGKVLGEVELDHFRQVGLFGGREQFLQMCHLVSDFVSAKETEFAQLNRESRGAKWSELSSV